LTLVELAPSLASVSDKEGNLPLHYLFNSFGPLVMHDFAIQLTIALVQHCDVNQVNNKNYSALTQAVQASNLKAIKFCIEFNQKLPHSQTHKKFDF
jgi:ankyrin repeat protein